MRKKIKKIVLIIFCLLIAAALIYIIPKAAIVLKLQKSAAAFVEASTENTFKDTKTTLVYDKNGNELCEIKNSKNMYYVEFGRIPTTLVYAFIAMEDREFFTHSGIDYSAIIRAAIANQQSNQVVQGASTITQQLARNIFLTHEVTWERKVEEIFIAWGLEKKYSKEQILEFYLNNIYFGNGFYGVEAAAKGYFDKTVSELTLSEQAFIAAIPNSPNKYNPFKNFDNAVARRDLILKTMYANEHISAADCRIATEAEVVLNPHENHEVNNSVVTYVRHCATESLMAEAGFSFRYNFESKDDWKAYDELYETYYARCQQQLFSGGFTVYTSIDVDLQQKLQAAVDEKLAGYTETSDEGVYKLQSAATCIDNKTGNVAAIVGSRTQDFEGYVLNRAYQSYRSPGSTIKPLSVYTPYLQLGNTPDTLVYDENFEGAPSNVDDSYDGEMTLREAVKRSKNTIAWRIYQQIKPNVGISFLQQMGFKKVWFDKEYVAGALGGFTYGVTTEEMAGGYAALANDGIYRSTTCINYITDSAGVVVADERNRGVRIYTSDSVKMMTDMLVSAMEPGGTGYAGSVDGVSIAGKTGTSNNNHDRWFCGYSAYYTVAVWVGYDYPASLGEAYENAVIFKQFMSTAHENLPDKELSVPANSGTDSDGNEAPENSESEEQENGGIEEETESVGESEYFDESGSSNSNLDGSGNSQSGNSGTSVEDMTDADVDINQIPGGDIDAGDIPGGDVDASENLGGDKDSQGNLGGDIDAGAIFGGDIDVEKR